MHLPKRRQRTFSLSAIAGFLLVVFLSTGLAATLRAESSTGEEHTALEKIAATFLDELQAHKEAALRTPKMFVYRSPVRRENDVHAYFVVWHTVESHWITMEPRLEAPSVLRGRVWVVGRAFRKAGLTPQAALEATPVKIGSDRTVLVLDWEKSGWRQIARAEWEYRLEEAKPGAGEW